MSIKKTIEQFIEESKSIHGSDSYSYDRCLEYINNKTKMELYCNKHKEYFSVTPNDHLGKKQCGCPKCGLENRKSSLTPRTFEEFISKAKEIHGNKYIYYDHKDSYPVNEYVDIGCPIHGVFTKIIGEHLRTSRNGGGCQKCFQEKQIIDQSTTKKDFINKANIIHENKYDYSLLPEILVKDKIDIICKKHGIFTQYKHNHLKGSNCPKCSNKISKLELEIVEYIKSFVPNIEIKQSYRPKWLDGKEIDIFIPDLNLGFEFNGTSFHHSSNSKYINNFFLNTYKDPLYHFNKWKICYDNNITLFSIYDFYWFQESKKKILLSKINHYLGLDIKIFARKCTLKIIDNKDAYNFYENNHIEGSGFQYKNSISVGLYYNNELFMCGTLGQFYNQGSKEFKYKLHRICTKLGYTIVGGISKIIKYFKQNVSNDFSYQITLSTGGSTLKYYKENIKFISPRYFWVNPNTWEYHHRNYTQKQVLEKHFGIPVEDDDTENTYMEKLGYLKVFDNGLAELKI